MMSKRASVAAMAFLLGVVEAFGQETKPNFTGEWTLDREKSDLGELGQGGSGGRGRGMGLGSFSITHEGNSLVLKRKVEFQGEERTFESRHSTDGKESVNEGFRGSTVSSKTRWEGPKLVTESVMETPNGQRETKEVRSLSADGKAMTVEIISKGSFGEGTRKLVYTKKD